MSAVGETNVGTSSGGEVASDSKGHGWGRCSYFRRSNSANGGDEFDAVTFVVVVAVLAWLLCAVCVCVKFGRRRRQAAGSAKRGGGAGSANNNDADEFEDEEGGGAATTPRGKKEPSAPDYSQDDTDHTVATSNGSESEFVTA